MQKIYVDTNVFLSYWFSEFGKNEDFQEYRAKKLMERTMDCEFVIIISGLVFNELSTASKLSKEEINNAWLNPLKSVGKLIIVEASNNDVSKANNLVRDKKVEHKADAIHAALAIKHKIPLITWNIKDYKNLKEIKVITPKEL